MLRLLVVLAVLSMHPALAVEQPAQIKFAVEKIDDSAAGTSASGYVFDITVQNIEQLDAILNRADQLRGQFSPLQHGKIALVLHGEELNLFRKKNYQQFMQIVERARLLDQQHLIDIKACQTVMQSLQIEQSELPEFIEQIPFAPIEIERLVKQKGYTRL
jgi:intracellular sulfur oxidation DsrE/DsrF family protein